MPPDARKSRAAAPVASGDCHPSADALEAYAMGKLFGSVLNGMEDHLLCCEDCRKRLSEIDEFLKAIRAALSKHRRRTEKVPRVISQNPPLRSRQ